MPGYRAVATEIEVDIKHSLDAQQFNEIKEQDSEEENLTNQKVEIVSDSESSSQSDQSDDFKNSELSKKNANVEVIFQNPVKLIEENERVKRHAKNIVDMMSQDSKHNLSPFVKKLKTASEEVN